MQHQFRKNYLRPLGKSYSSLDAGIFKKYLHLPKVYLRGILRRYPTNLNEVPPLLPQLIKECDDFLWRRIKMEERSKEEQILLTYYKIAGVPPMWATRNDLPNTTGANLKVYQQILDNPAGFAKLGRVLYLHSTFEENSLLAASNIVKAGIRSKLACKMVPLATFMEEVKTFEESKVLRSLETADIACLTMLANLYVAKSGFTESTLATFIDKRRNAGRTTILSCHLNAAEFKERYSLDLGRFGAVVMEFKDSGVVATVSELAKELAALKGGK